MENTKEKIETEKHGKVAIYKKYIYKSQYWSYKLTITTYRVYKKSIPFTKAKKKKKVRA